MARISFPVLIVSALAYICISTTPFVGAQGTTESTTSDAPAPAGCIIATPQKDLCVGREYPVELTNCDDGEGDILLRYGDVNNLDIADDPACTDVDFKSGECFFKPKTVGKFSFSANYGSGKETFSAFFNVLDCKKKKTTKLQSSSPSNPQTVKETTRMANVQKRALYDIAAFAF